MEETPLEASSSFAAPAKKKINKRFVYLIAAFVIIILVFFGSKLLGQSSKQDINDVPAITTPTEIPTLTPESSPTPASNAADASPTSTPTPKPTVNPVDKSTGLNRSKLSVTVQNGSGQAGVAGKAADILKALGYNVSSTGNADNYDFVNVSIQVKAAESEFLALLKKDLASYTIGSNSADLSTSFSSDALVIIGK
ncbi:MAG: LytR C-terminal domain-containing protein [Patescibacteria group bacterium]